MTYESKEQLLDIPLSEIIQEINARGDYKESGIDEMMTSLRQYGQLEPIGVRMNGEKYEVMYGNRRVVAAKKLGWSTIQGIIKGTPAGTQAADIELMFKNAIENLQRKDPPFPEQGKIFHDMLKAGLTIKEIAAGIGIQSTRIASIANAFQRVPDWLRQDVVLHKKEDNREGNKISMKNANAVISWSKGFTMQDHVKDQLFKFAMKPDVTPEKIGQVTKLIRSGISFKSATKYIGSVKVVSVNFLMVENQIEAMEKTFKKSIKTQIYEFVKKSGKFPLAKVADEITTSGKKSKPLSRSPRA